MIATDPEGFGEQLRRHRRLAGLSQESLAEQAGLSVRGISDLERGARRYPRLDTIRRLARVLKLSPSERASLIAAGQGPAASAQVISITARRPDSHGDTPDPAQPRSVDAGGGRFANLPIQPTALLGRVREVADIAEMIHDGARLVSLTGPGGVGKTRLALEIAAELADDFEYGVALVELAPIVDPSLVPATIAQVLGVRDVGGRPVLESLREYLRSRPILLVLDNYEQILASAFVVSDLLAACSGLTVLVTSREPLKMRGEHEYAVPPLALPDIGRLPTPELLSQYAACALFVERATAIRSDFDVTPASVAIIAEICTRLDGLPLAIELAAARSRLLSPETMLNRLERRLPLLTGGARDLPLRQQTLRAAITWSHDLLDEHERQLFRRLAVFVGGWPLETAEAVCNLEGDLDILAGLESLVSKSLVRQEGDGRFRMLETIREYAAEQLAASGELEAVRRRHAEHFLVLVEEAEDHLHGDDQLVWLRRLNPERDNIRAVLAWSHAQDGGEVGLRLAGALHLFWRFGGYVGEGRRWLTDLLALPGGTARSRARALLADSILAIMQGDYQATRELAEQSAEMFSRLHDRACTGRALTYLAVGLFGEGRYAEARPFLEASIAACREAGDTWGLSNALGQFSSIPLQQGDLPAALAVREEALANARKRGDRWQIGLSLMGVARIVGTQDDHRRAGGLYLEALTVLREVEDLWLGPRALSGVACVDVVDGHSGRAVRLFGAAEAMRELAGTHEMPAWRAHFDTAIASAHAALGGEAFEAAWDEGRAMTPAQAIAYALDEHAERL